MLRQVKMRQDAARAFTLIEILIVIALTAVLFALLLIPLVSALRYTQQAQIVTAAQDAARIAKERITRELGSAVFVFDGTSHPFQTSNMIKPGDDAYTNFLDLPILSSTGTPVVAQAFNAKLDFVLPKLNDNGATIDPTTNEPITYSQSQNGSAIIGNPSYVFPLAAGTNMIRYFVALKDPTKPYNNTREGKTIIKGDGSDDNTYILYRAEFQPYLPVTDASGKVTGVKPDMRLFAVRNNASGVSIPELDDPDFFRYVNINADGTQASAPTDTNWLDDTHGLFPTQTAASSVTDATADGSAAQHNYRVSQWMQIAKPVIPGPNVDLLELPHNADNTLAYDTSGAFSGVAHSGVATDPVTMKTYPIVNTSCTFRPATISGNATPGTTADYNSQGVVSTDQSGFTYIPTFYTASSQSWSLPYHVTLFPGTYGQPNTDPNINAALSMYYDTEQFAGATTTVAATGYTASGGPLAINPGDILEYKHLPSDMNTQGTLVYNVTQGYPVMSGSGGSGYTLGGNQFVPMTINPDTGTIMFTAPSLPNGPYDRLTRAWQYIPLTLAATPNAGGIASDGTVDLTLPASNPAKLTDSPLQGFHTLTATSGLTQTGVLNAHIVPGSARVTGPDQTAGPNQGQPVSYTEIKSSVGIVGENQFYIDYGTSILHLSSIVLQPQAGQTIVAPVSVIYDYQANMSLTTPLASPPPSTFTSLDLTTDPYQPMQVSVDYQTRDLIDVSIGVRIYDVTNNRAQVIPAETKIKIGNSNR